MTILPNSVSILLNGTFLLKEKFYTWRSTYQYLPPGRLHMQAMESWFGDQAFEEGADDLVTVTYKSHQDALVFLRSVLNNQEGIGLLQGPKASGKTTIVRHLAEQLPSGASVALVDGARIKPHDLLSRTLVQFGYDTGLESEDELMKMMKVFAIQQTRVYEPPILIIDNLDRMYPSTLRTLNILAELNVQERFAFRIIVTGCEGLGALVESDGMSGIRKRNAGSFQIQPLSLKEALIYLHAKLAAFGVNNGDTVFPVDVCDRLCQQSGGWPGLLNRFAIEAIRRATSLPIKVADTGVLEDVEIESVPDMPVSGSDLENNRLPPRLTITKDGKVVSEYTFNQNKALVGRSDFADIMIDDNFVSKMHAVILLYSDALVLLDLNSANGITVNSVRVRSTILKNDDIITLGDHRLKVRNAPAISDEIAKLLEVPDTVKMKNLMEMRQLRAQRLALVVTESENQG